MLRSRLVPPWRERWFALVTLWDMQKFAAESFTTILLALERMWSEWGRVRDDRTLPGFHPNEDERSELERDLRLVQRLLTALGLPVSAQTVDEFRQALISIRHVRMNAQDVVMRLDEIQRNIQREMRAVVLLRVDKPEYYDQDEPLFGEQVKSAFPSAAFDIEEAGKCLAVGRSTAAVLHLMRGLEVGLQALAKQFRQPFEHASWNAVVGKIEARIREIENRKRKPRGWQKDRQFYAEAAVDFRLIKDAWRNYAMHVHDTYTEEQALSIFSYSRAFMQHLAKRLHE